MCGKKPKPAPPVVQRDPVADQAKAEAEAQQAANADTANRRRRRGWSGALSGLAMRNAGALGGPGAKPDSLFTPAADPRT